VLGNIDRRGGHGTLGGGFPPFPPTASKTAVVRMEAMAAAILLLLLLLLLLRGNWDAHATEPSGAVMAVAVKCSLIPASPPNRRSSVSHRDARRDTLAPAL